MEYRENGSRWKGYKKWDKAIQTPYDYEQNGISQHILSKSIVGSDNRFVKYILKVYDHTIVHVLKSIDYLKHFKNFYWKNR